MRDYQSIGATSVPALVCRHQEDLLGTGFAMYAGSFLTKSPGIINSKLADGTDYLGVYEAGRAWSTGYADILNIAALFHVSEEMTAVALQLSKKLPDSMALLEETLPSKHGFLIFEKPFYFFDVRGLVTGISGVKWSSEGDRLAFCWLTDADDMNDEVNKTLRHMDDYKRFARFVPSHIVNTRIGATLGHLRASDPTNSPEAIAKYLEENPSMTELDDDHMEVLRAQRDKTLEPLPMNLNLFSILLAVFELMRQPMAELSEYTDKKMARRNFGKSRPLPLVTVIKLRRPEEFGARDEGTGQWLTYRSLTRSHFRRVHTKEGVRWTLIHAYWRGPEDAPIWQPKRVASLQR